MSVDIQQKCAIKLLVYDMSLQDFVVESLRGTLCAGHVDGAGSVLPCVICSLCTLLVFLESGYVIL